MDIRDMSFSNIRPPARMGTWESTFSSGGNGYQWDKLNNLVAASKNANMDEYLKTIKPGKTGMGGSVPDIPGIDSGFGWNMSTANLLASGLGGIGDLAKGYAALKNIGVARDGLDFQKEAFNKNFNQSLKAYQDNANLVNNDIRAQQNFIQKTHRNPDFSHLKTLQV